MTHTCLPDGAYTATRAAPGSPAAVLINRAMKTLSCKLIRILMATSWQTLLTACMGWFQNSTRELAPSTQASRQACHTAMILPAAWQPFDYDVCINRPSIVQTSPHKWAVSGCSGSASASGAQLRFASRRAGLFQPCDCTVCCHRVGEGGGSLSQLRGCADVLSIASIQVTFRCSTVSTAFACSLVFVS